MCRRGHSYKQILPSPKTSPPPYNFHKKSKERMIERISYYLRNNSRLSFALSPLKIFPAESQKSLCINYFAAAKDIGLSSFLVLEIPLSSHSKLMFTQQKLYLDVNGVSTDLENLENLKLTFDSHFDFPKKSRNLPQNSKTHGKVREFGCIKPIFSQSEDPNFETFQGSMRSDPLSLVSIRW